MTIVITNVRRLRSDVTPNSTHARLGNDVFRVRVEGRQWSTIAPNQNDSEAISRHAHASGGTMGNLSAAPRIGAIASQ